MRSNLSSFFAALAAALCVFGGGEAARAQELLSNGSLETLNQGLPVDWDFHSNASAGVNTDPANARTGNNSLRFDLSLGSNPEWDHKLFAVQSGKVYRITCYYKTVTPISSGALDVYVRWWPGPSRANLVSQERLKTDIGIVTTSGWEGVDRVTVSPDGAAYCDVIVYSVAGGPNGLVFMDDFSVEETVIPRVIETRPYPTLFPKASKPPAPTLYTFDLRGKPMDTVLAVSTLQGIVNRQEPRIYTINQTADEQWLTFMQEKGYTGTPVVETNWLTLVNRFKGELSGKVIYDPNLPGSINAACMVASVRNGIVLSPTLEWQVDVPVLEDMRGRWTRNVDAYRYVYDTYWPEMNHFMLASVYPLTAAQYVRDYLTANKVFTFWLSGDTDGDVGEAPTDERALIDELLANTPTCVPVWGWFSYGTPSRGIPEYDAVRWISQYGKFLPGTEFSSNLSVLSGITITTDTFRQTWASRAPRLTLDPSKVYVCLNVLDSGDAQWYWQSRQLDVWGDGARGHVPIGWSLNPTVVDTMPLVLQWYYDHATPDDCLISAVSGAGYMFTTHYGEVYADRDAVWKEFADFTNQYCNETGLDIVEMYDGGWGEQTPPSTKILSYYTEGVSGLRGLFLDMGRHDNIQPNTADYLFDGVPVFHCLTRYLVPQGTPEEEVAWTKSEILNHLPTKRPGFMNTWMDSWTMYPTQIQEVADGLTSDVVAVTPYQMLDLYDQYLATRNWALNGNFESGTLGHWEYWKRGPAEGTATIVSDDRSGTGSSACRLTRTTAGAFADEDLVFISTNDPLFPNCQVRKDHSYRLTFWAKTSQPSQTFSVNMTPMESPDFSDLMTETESGIEVSRFFTTSGQWQKFTLPVFGPIDSTRRIQVGFRLVDQNLRGAPGDLTLDDISLVETGVSNVNGWMLLGGDGK